MSDPLTYAFASLKRAAGNGYPWSVSPYEAAALVAEVERLRAAVKAERAAVVAWLRERHVGTKEWDGRVNAVSHTYDHAADAIERGEHRREEGA